MKVPKGKFSGTNIKLTSLLRLFWKIKQEMMNATGQEEQQTLQPIDFIQACQHAITRDLPDAWTKDLQFQDPKTVCDPVCNEVIPECEEV